MHSESQRHYFRNSACVAASSQTSAVMMMTNAIPTAAALCRREESLSRGTSHAGCHSPRRQICKRWPTTNRREFTQRKSYRMGPIFATRKTAAEETQPDRDTTPIRKRVRKWKIVRATVSVSSVSQVSTPRASFLVMTAMRRPFPEPSCVRTAAAPDNTGKTKTSSVPRPN